MTFIDRLLEYLRNDAPREDPPQWAVYMAELAPGVVAVESTDGESSESEIDIYFDLEMLRPCHPRKWARDGLRPRATAKHGIGVLPGMACRGGIEDMNGAMEFARRELRSKSRDASWFSTPRTLIPAMSAA